MKEIRLRFTACDIFLCCSVLQTTFTAVGILSFLRNFRIHDSMVYQGIPRDREHNYFILRHRKYSGLHKRHMQIDV